MWLGSFYKKTAPHQKRGEKHREKERSNSVRKKRRRRSGGVKDAHSHDRRKGAERTRTSGRPKKRKRAADTEAGGIGGGRVGAGTVSFWQA